MAKALQVSYILKLYLGIGGPVTPAHSQVFHTVTALNPFVSGSFQRLSMQATMLFTITILLFNMGLSIFSSQYDTDMVGSSQGACLMPQRA